MTLPSAAVTNWIQALSAVATVVLTYGLMRVSLRYTRETRRMADVMARDLEIRVAPLLDFELYEPRVVNGWESAKVPVVIRNLGTHSAEIVSAALEFRVTPGAADFMSEPLPSAQLAVEPGHPRRFDVLLPLSKISPADRQGPNAGGRVVFQVSYTARGVTGEKVAGRSQEFRL